MIIANLKGGLGNQLFQIAAGYALELEYGKDTFAINYALQHNLVQGNRASKYRDNLFRNIPVTGSIPGVVYSEPHFHYRPITEVENVMIDGYFQSIKYFQKQSNAIKNLFTFSDALRDKCSSKLDKLREKYSMLVGLHVRRGDYQRFPTIHPLCTEQYYRDAIKQFPENAAVIVCSDDPNWCAHNLNDCTILCDSKSEIEDLFVLSQCDASIMSNSSFSWWGTFLGNKKDKVIAPKVWFGPEGYQDYQDIYCNGWSIV